MSAPSVSSIRTFPRGCEATVRGHLGRQPFLGIRLVLLDPQRVGSAGDIDHPELAGRRFTKAAPNGRRSPSDTIAICVQACGTKPASRPLMSKAGSVVCRKSALARSAGAEVQHQGPWKESRHWDSTRAGAHDGRCSGSVYYRRSSAWMRLLRPLRTT